MNIISNPVRVFGRRELVHKLADPMFVDLWDVEVEGHVMSINEVGQATQDEILSFCRECVRVHVAKQVMEI